MDNLSLGEWTFPNLSLSSASFTLEYNGTISNANNIIVKNARIARAEISSNNNTYNIRTNKQNDHRGCDIVITPLPSIDRIAPNSTADLTVGAQVSITNPKQCVAQTYTSSFTITMGTYAFKTIPLTYTINKAKIISFEETQELDFGKIVSAATTKTLTVNPQNDTISGSAMYMERAHRGIFKIKGDPNTQFTISPIAETILMSPGGTATSGLPMQFETYSGQIIGDSGEDNVYVGGTLTIPSHSQAGTYSSTYSITVNY